MVKPNPLLWLTGMLLSTPAFADPTGWFEKNTPLTQAHQHLLNNDLESMFSSLVEVWQLEKIKPENTSEQFIDSVFKRGLRSRAR